LSPDVIVKQNLLELHNLDWTPVHTWGQFSNNFASYSFFVNRQKIEIGLLNKPKSTNKLNI